jgi:hypothetical protein
VIAASRSPSRWDSGSTSARPTDSVRRRFPDLLRGWPSELQGRVILVAIVVGRSFVDWCPPLCLRGSPPGAEFEWRGRVDLLRRVKGLIGGVGLALEADADLRLHFIIVTSCAGCRSRQPSAVSNPTFTLTNAGYSSSAFTPKRPQNLSPKATGFSPLRYGLSQSAGFMPVSRRLVHAITCNQCFLQIVPLEAV